MNPTLKFAHMDNDNLFELNLDELSWKWDIIDFWALPLHQKGQKPQTKKEEKESDKNMTPRQSSEK